MHQLRVGKVERYQPDNLKLAWRVRLPAAELFSSASYKRMLRYLKTVCFSEQIMSADKYIQANFRAKWKILFIYDWSILTFFQKQRKS